MKINYPSACLKRNISFTVLVPVEQDPFTKELTAEDGKKYKSLYLLHGFGGDCNDWILNTRIYKYAEEHQMAVIMPSGENRFYLDNERSGEAYTKFIGEELVNCTRHLLPLSEKREDTLIGGLSMGGYGAVTVGLNYPETFGGILAMSSALIAESVAKMKPGDHNGIADYSYYESVFGDPKDVLASWKNPKYQVESLQKEHRQIPEIFLACGTEDFLVTANREFHSYLEEHEVPHTYVEDAGEHNWDFWDRHIQTGLRWYDSICGK